MKSLGRWDLVQWAFLLGFFVADATDAVADHNDWRLAFLFASLALASALMLWALAASVRVTRREFEDDEPVKEGDEDGPRVGYQCMKCCSQVLAAPIGPYRVCEGCGGLMVRGDRPHAVEPALKVEGFFNEAPAPGVQRPTCAKCGEEASLIERSYYCPGCHEWLGDLP